MTTLTARSSLFIDIHFAITLSCLTAGEGRARVPAWPRGVNMKTTLPLFLLFVSNFLAGGAQNNFATASREESTVKQVVDQYMQPLLAQSGAPGAIVGVSIHGRRYFYTYGKATDEG